MATKVIGIDCLYSSSLVEIPYSPEHAKLIKGEEIIFKDSENKEEFGIVRYTNCDLMDESVFLAGSKILRKATPNDTQKVFAHLEQANSYLRVSKRLVEKIGLDMQVFRAGYSFDGSRVCFMFTSEDRVDFRELVKELANVIKKQIHLRQVGPRDRAKMLGGFGRCGRLRCSTTFLRNLESVNMEMVRVQGLEGRGSSKLSGVCGKLLCSLKFEVDTYRALRENLPDIGERVRTKKTASFPPTEGNIIGLDILNQKLKVLAENNKYFFVTAADVDKIYRAGSWKNFSIEKPVSAKNTAKIAVDVDHAEKFLEGELAKFIK